MRKIDYLELCQFVGTKQDFVLRWLPRYYQMIRLYWSKTQLLLDQIDTIWGNECDLPPDEQTQVWLLYKEIERLKVKRKRCWARYDTLVRYGQYFGNLPFRVLRNESIPDCFWYVPISGMNAPLSTHE